MRCTLLGALLIFASTVQAADSSPALGSLTYSGEQKALESLDREIVSAGLDGPKLAAIEKQLLALLRRTDATFAGRQAAAQRLGRLLGVGAPKTSADAFKPLGTMLLEERDSDLARLALEPVRSEVVDGIFVEALEKTTGRTRLGVVDSIGRRRSVAAVPSLAKLLQSSDPATLAAAARALGEISDPTAVAALHAFPEPSATPIATAKLAAAPRLPAAAALGLLNELQRKARDPVHRAAAFRQSLDIEVGNAAARIAEVLSGRDMLMKQVALESLTASRAPNLVSTLTAKLSTWDAPTQRSVIASLGRRADPAATNAITAAVKHKDADVRATAIEALGFVPGTRDTATLLAKIAADDESADAKIARQSLSRLNGPDVGAAIIAGAERGDARSRIAYLDQLALRNMTEALPLLLKMRGDPDASVRAAAVGALGEIAPPTEQQALLDWTIAATDPAEQARALRSLVNVTLRDQDPAERGRAIFAAIDSAPPELALRLLPALNRIGGSASAETAARLAIRDSAEISEAATTALTRWSDATALGALATVAEKAARPAARTAALEGALRYFERNRDPWTAEITSVLSRLLASTDQLDWRKQFVLVLHRANDNQAVALAEKLKSDPALAAESAIAADVIRANMAGTPKIQASNAIGVASMTDAQASTRWTTPMIGEEWVEIEFKSRRPIVRVTLEQTNRPAEFPEQYEVFVTDTRDQPGKAVTSGKGQRNRTVIDLPTGTRGRYLIIKNVAERKDTPWAISELYVD